MGVIGGHRITRSSVNCLMSETRILLSSFFALLIFAAKSQ
jgi:hypothetical protein